MAITLNGYWNRFERSNGYKRHLFRAARGLQSAEMNEVHDYIHDNFVMFADFLIGDGVVMQGGGININEDADEAFVEEGAFIADGYVLELVARNDITITAVGTYNIGAIVKEQVITELTDPDLRDPATGTRNYNEPGAGALHITARWALDSELSDPTTERFFPVHKVVDGLVVSGKTSEQPEDIADPVKELVAQYDRDGNGNYIVEGYGVSFDIDDATEEEHVMVIDSGRAHVYGYLINRSHRSKLRLRWGTDTAFTNNEPINFIGDGWYTLRNLPISDMVEVFGITREQDEAVTRVPDVPIDSDELINQPVVDIELVSSLPGGAGTVYVEGVDWQQTGNSVEWLGGGSSPTPGSTYYVTYTWNQDITGAVVISADKTQIQIIGLVTGTIAYADYNFFIPRYDKIIIGRDGDFQVIEGTPNQPDLIRPPINTQGLALSDVLIEYGKEPVCGPAGTRAYQMKDIEYIMQILQDVRYNMSRMAQVTDAGLRDPSTNKKNMFVEPFHDEDLLDLGLDNNAAIADGHLMGAIDWTPNVIRSGDLIRLPYTETIPEALKNTAYSKTRKVNELDIVINEQSMSIVPKSFQWISSFTGSGNSPQITNDPGAEIPTIPADGGPVTLTVTGGVYASSELVAIYIDGDQVLGQGDDTLAGSIDPTEFQNGLHYWTTDVDGNFSFTIDIPAGVKACRDMNDSIVIETVGYTSRVGAIDYFFAAARLGKTAFNVLQGQLNSQRASINANTRRIGSLERGVAQLGRGLNALTGDVAALGQRVTRLERTPPVQISQTFTTNVTQVFPVRRTTVIRNVTRRWWGGGNGGGDPLAQTFIPEESAFLTSCEIFVTTKPANVDNTKNFMEVAIHGVQVGIPDRTEKVASKFLRTENITEGAWNKFTFDEPVLVEAGVEYSIVVFSPDTETYIRVAEIGQWNLESGNTGWMESQPHHGVLLQSANRSTWTALQKEDMTFRLNQANHSLTLVDDLIGSLAVTNATDLNLTVGYDEYPGTLARFHAILPDRLNERQELPTNKTIKIEEYSGQVDVYVNLASNDSNISPVVDGDVTLSVGQVQFPATYTARAFDIDLTDGISDTMKVWLDRYEPANTDIEVYLQTSGDGTLPGHWTLVPMIAETPIGDGWMDTEYGISGLQVTFGPVVQEVRMRVVLDSTDPQLFDRPQAENLRAYIAVVP